MNIYMFFVYCCLVDDLFCIDVGEFGIFGELVIVLFRFMLVILNFDIGS